MKKITAILLFACIVGQAYAWKPKFAGHRGSYRGVENTEEAMMNGINHFHHNFAWAHYLGFSILSNNGKFALH